MPFMANAPFTSGAPNAASAVAGPAGLANYGNTCFLNAILQALMHCRPLVGLFGLLADRLHDAPVDAPFLRALAALFREAVLLPADAAEGQLSRRNALGGRTLSPALLQDALKGAVASSALGSGNQEDAQELFTFLVDRLHEELLANRAALKWALGDELASAAGTALGGTLAHPAPLLGSSAHQLAAGDWFEVANNSRRLSRARTMAHDESPISRLAFGRYRSIIRRTGAKDSITTEPFHCISLDIGGTTTGAPAGPPIQSLDDALRRLVHPEVILASGGVRKRLLLERVPDLLVIQLKRFTFSPAEGTAKCTKFVSYPEQLRLDDALMCGLGGSPEHQRPFTLFAVVHHHGRTAEGGHYTCDCRSSLAGHQGAPPPWVHFNDAVVEGTTLEAVLGEKANKAATAYLLFYLRAPP